MKTLIEQVIPTLLFLALGFTLGYLGAVALTGV